jgi:hypothetical protein
VHPNRYVLAGFEGKSLLERLRDTKADGNGTGGEFIYSGNLQGVELGHKSIFFLQNYGKLPEWEREPGF